MKKLLKKISDKKKLKKSAESIGLKGILDHSFLWTFNCQSVAIGTAIGLFVGMIPLIPCQTIIAIILCLILRGNFAIAFAVSWISNPITILPLAYLTYLIGNFIIGEKGSSVILQKMNWNIFKSDHIWSSFVTLSTQFGKAFFIGLPVIALSAALIGYLLVVIGWQIICIIRKIK